MKFPAQVSWLLVSSESTVVLDAMAGISTALTAGGPPQYLEFAAIVMPAAPVEVTV